MKADVAIVGAGLAGILCARRLVAAGLTVVLFDKGRKPGGRLSTRRAETTRFDHGAPLFTARSPRFQAVVQGWAAEGFVARWEGRFWRVGADATRTVWRPSAWVGTPSMSSIPAALAAGLNVRTRVRVGSIARAGGEWALRDEDGAALGIFGAVIVNTPSGQAAPLLGDAPTLQEAARAVSMAPCWSVMVVPEQPWSPGFDAAEFERGPVFRAFSQASKPGRDATPGWVLHARSEWSQAQWESNPEAVIEALLRSMEAASGLSFGPVRHAKAHRWQYARGSAGLADGCLWDAEARAGACGDWCGGPGLEGAWHSAHALADRIV
ncbi:MAG: NAD(P)/FAD-dependent oxidoreductase [Nannocystales bacterium]